MACSYSSRTDILSELPSIRNPLSKRTAPLARLASSLWGSFLLRSLLPLILAVAASAPATASAFPDHAPQLRALVLEPFAVEIGGGQTAGQTEGALLQQAGYAVTILRGAKVTVYVMRHLADYSFVYMVTHAGPLPNNDAAIATGDTRHHLFAPYFKNNTLAQMHIIGEQPGVFKYFDAVTGRFIHRYDHHFAPHSIVFVDSCNALDMPRFWKYLHESGVATLISWHRHVDSGEAQQAGKYILTDLVAGETVGQAIRATQAIGLGTSTLSKRPGSLSFRGDGANVLPVTVAPSSSGGG